MILDMLGTIGGIVLLDLILSGDNALVIGAAASALPRKQRWSAIVVGGAGAILLRILCASLATVLLNVQWIQTIGALILVGIAIKLLVDRKNSSQASEGEERSKRMGQSFIAAMLTILVADVTMSLDNILAVGALANGNYVVLAFGLLVSIAVLLFGSALVAELMGRFFVLLDVAALVLAWTGASMVLDDLRESHILQLYPWIQLVVYCIFFGSILLAEIILFSLHKRQQTSEVRPIKKTS